METHRQLFPLTGGREAVEVHQRDAVQNGVADLDYADQSTQGAFVNLVPSQRLRVIEKISQEPAQLPHRLRGAVQPADDRLPGIFLGLQNRQPKYIERFLRMPAMLGMVETDKVDAVGDSGTRFLDRRNSS